MLLACLTLSICMTSCSSDEFETNLSEEPQQLSKAELIEQALSRMPQTRSNDNLLVLMVTIKKTVTIRCMASEEVKIHWDKDSTSSVTTYKPYTYTFPDDIVSHAIFLYGSPQAIKNLTLSDNGLILLNVTRNASLTTLYCMDNNLDALNLTGCQSLKTLYIANNELSSIDIKDIPLEVLRADNNQLRTIDVTENSELSSLNVGKNKITKLYLDKNTNLKNLDVSFNRITDLDLSQNTKLSFISLEDLPIETINDTPINKASFSAFYDLRELNIANTDFDSLDLSNNKSLLGINISGTAISQLDVSQLPIQYLRATRSKLSDLIYLHAVFEDLYELRIERTPFESDLNKVGWLVPKLPKKTEENPGHLYTYSSYFDSYVDYLTRNNWVINR